MKTRESKRKPAENLTGGSENQSLPEEVENHQETETADGASLPDAAIASLEAKVAGLSQALDEAQEEARKSLEGWQRTQANFENFRKRMTVEKAEWTTTANMLLLSRLLPVIDDFARAFLNLPEELQDHSWPAGIKLVEQKLRRVLEMEDVKPIPVEPGDVFDPYFHQAVVQQEVEEYEDGQIVAEVQTGYLLGNRVLRPALVVVARPKPTTATEDETQATASNEAQDSAAEN